MNDKTMAIPVEDFEETMVNATPDELKQVSAWLQECGRIDAQRCEMDEDKPPISFDKPPFPLEVKKAKSEAAGTVTAEPGSALTIKKYLESLTDTEKDCIGNLRVFNCRPDAILFNGDMMDIKLNSGEAVKDPYAAMMVANPGMKRRDVKDAYYRNAYGGADAWTHNPQTETTAQLMIDRINAGYNRKAGTFDTEVKPRSAKTAAFHAVLKKMTWRLSKMGMAFEVWCSIGLSVVTGPWEERHD